MILRAILFFVAATCAAQSFIIPNVTDIKCPYVDEMTRAIWVSEGGSKTRYPYGVKSIRTRSVEHARQITVESVHANYANWIRAGRPGGNTPRAFVDYMSKRWVPVASDPVGNANWRRNVRILLNREIAKTRLTDHLR